MSGTNRVVGGMVCTGIFASLWNVKIFSKIEYLEEDSAPEVLLTEDAALEKITKGLSWLL